MDYNGDSEAAGYLYNQVLRLNLDVQQEFSESKMAVRNAVEALKQRRDSWQWQPAIEALETYFSSCILFAYIGGIPEQSKGEKDGTVYGYWGHHLSLRELTQAAGTLRILSWLICQDWMLKQLQKKSDRRLYAMCVIRW